MLVAVADTVGKKKSGLEKWVMFSPFNNYNQGTFEKGRMLLNR